jgi:hypothetical protein
MDGEKQVTGITMRKHKQLKFKTFPVVKRHVPLTLADMVLDMQDSSSMLVGIHKDSPMPVIHAQRVTVTSHDMKVAACLAQRK